MSKSEDEKIRHHALMEWNTAAQGWKKVRKRHAQVDGSYIGSAHKVGWDYFWADSTRCRHR
ncbi:MAG: hypothetical protein M3299_06500, partial [Thermoproteota archaeon]|nr:hypothetical protein [Thermoproteota archaeon]